MKLIPGLHKSLKNTASVRFTSIQFVFFRLDLDYFWNKPSSLRSNFSNLWNKQTSLRFENEVKIEASFRLRFDIVAITSPQIETQTKRQATQHECLPNLLGDGDKGNEIVYGEDIAWAD